MATELGGGVGRNMMTSPEAAISFQGSETDLEESEVETEDEQMVLVSTLQDEN